MSTRLRDTTSRTSSLGKLGDCHHLACTHIVPPAYARVIFFFWLINGDLTKKKRNMIRDDTGLVGRAV